MCILCVIQKWSRRVATMLPWLVIPLIGLWALSQLLPPAFRFEITSPRLACVFVLLITLFWYEILMPQLSAWRVRRNAQLRERKRFEAIEMQKLRKTATRRCRNCLTPYRDQNPGAGKFMCSYCGHVSKRPVLDLPVPPGLGISNSGIIKELVGKGGNILNGKAWSDNGWMCSQDWLENGNWVGASIGGKPSYWQKSGNGSGIFGGDEDCLAEKSYSRVVIFACKLLTSIFLCIRWLWRKIFRISSSNEDGSSDVEHRGMLPKRGENGENFHESRGEKTRRKAEEKRQARIERELLEEEERKQREEVARLVEERRKLRDEKMEAERERSKSSLLNRERESKKDAEKKRQERRKEKDKGSSKSNSDVEELERRAGKESDRKKTEADHREHQKSGSESVKGLYLESGRGTKNSTGSNLGRGSAGTRYLDRMKGTFLSSSRALSGSGFFGKSYNAPVNVTKEIKFNSPVDHVHTYAQRRDLCHQEHQIEKPFVNGDDKNLNRPVLLETQPMTLPKKSWQQLFTRSSVTPANSNPHVISRPNSKLQAEFQSPPLSGHSSPIQSFDNPINFVPPSPFTVSSYLNVSSSSSLGFSHPIESIYSPVVDNPPAYLPEEPELFEDPCYDPDPISLLGPVSESLVNFQMDRGTGFSSNREFERPCALNSLPTSPEVSKPSPIVSPLSRLRVADEKHGGPNLFSYTPNTQDLQSHYTDNSQLNEKGSWQMWKSSPLGQDGPGCWLLPNERKSSTEDDIMQPASQKTMASLFSKDDQIVSGTRSPQKAFLGNGQNSVLFSSVNGSSDNDPWMHSTFFPPLSGSDNPFPAKLEEESKQNELVYRSPTGAASSHAFELPPTNWSRRETPIHGSGDGIGKTSVPRANIGGLFPSQDVKSVWSYDSRKGESDSVRDLKYLL